MAMLTPDILLRAYSCGVFPMARSRDDPKLYWVEPQERGILPLDGLHVPRSLIKALRRGAVEVRCDSAFAAVLDGCAEPAPDRPDTWINDQIHALFMQLHRLGLAHSVECWRDGRLVGGLYGLALGGAFFGESMFSRETDASKVALVHLCARLDKGGFTLLDTQFVTDHLRRFGALEIGKQDYLDRLAAAVGRPARFYGAMSDEEVLSFARDASSRSRQSSTQRS
jgi:leucyl/phenylalanyl-tRNA--protein transferase